MKKVFLLFIILFMGINEIYAQRKFKIQIHVLRRSDGSGFDLSAMFGSQNTPSVYDCVNNLIQYANNVYSPLGIEFFTCNSVNYIDSDYWYNMEAVPLPPPNPNNPNEPPPSVRITTTTSQIQPLFSQYNYSDAINIYYCLPPSTRRQVIPSSTFPWWTYNLKDHMLFRTDDLNYNIIDSKNLFIHELGHYFGLHHTFPSEDCNIYPSLSGDMDEVADTPQGPIIKSFNSGNGNCNQVNCVYTGNPAYSPLVNNYMNYAWTCMNSFTQGQKNRIMFYKQYREYVSCKPCNFRGKNVGYLGNNINNLPNPYVIKSDIITASGAIELPNVYLEGKEEVQLTNGFQASHTFADGFQAYINPYCNMVRIEPVPSYMQFRQAYNNEESMPVCYGAIETIEASKIMNEKVSNHEITNVSIVDNESIKNSDVEKVEELKVSEPYPNPNNGIFEIVLKDGNNHVEVINAMGQIIYTKSWYVQGNTKVNIDISGVNTGFYTLRVKNNNVNKIHKLSVVK